MHLTCPSCGATFSVDPQKLGPDGRKVRCGDCAHTWHQGPPDEDDTAQPLSVEAAEEPLVPAEPEPEPVIEEDDDVVPVAVDAADEDLSVDAVFAAEEASEVDQAPRELPRRPAELGERKARRAQSRSRRPEPKRGSPALILGWTVFLFVAAGLASGFVLGRDRLVTIEPRMARLYDLIGLKPAKEELGLDLLDVKSVRRMIDGKRVLVIEGLIVNRSGKTRKVPPLRASLIDSSGNEIDRWTFKAAGDELSPGGTMEFETVAKNPPREGNLAIDFVLQE